MATAAPVPQPMLAKSGPIPTRGQSAFEVKWDGFRAVVASDRGLRVLSRRGWEMTELVPELDWRYDIGHESAINKRRERMLV